MASLSELLVKIRGDSTDYVADVNLASLKTQEFQKSLTTLNAKMASAAKASGAASMAFQRAGHQLTLTSRQMRATNFHTGNLAAQFNDIGVMMASGQSPFMLAVQQGAQVSQVLNSIKASGGSATKALIGGFTQFFNPLTAATIALTGLAAWAGQYAINAMSAADETDNLTDSLKELADAADEAQLKAFALRQGIENLSQASVQRGLLQAVADIKAYEQEIARLEASRESGYRREIRHIRQKIQGQQEYIKSLREQLGIFISSNIELKRAEEFAEGMQFEATLFEDAMEGAAKRAAKTAEEAQKIADRMAAAKASASDFLASMAPLARAEDLLFGQPVTGPTGGQLAVDNPWPQGTTSGSGGAAARAGVTEEDIKRLQEGFMTEAELQLAQYTEQQSMLEEALQNKLITQQEYNKLMEQAQKQHSDTMASIDAYRYGTTLDKTEAFLGDMANAFASGNEKMVKIGRVFSAAQAFISTMAGAAEALKLPFPANLAAAAKVIATGMGFVNAIRSVNDSGGTPGAPGAGTSGAAAGGGATAATATPRITDVSINVRGQVFDRASVVGLIESINDAIGDGARIRAT